MRFEKARFRVLLFLQYATFEYTFILRTAIFLIFSTLGCSHTCTQCLDFVFLLAVTMRNTSIIIGASGAVATNSVSASNKEWPHNENYNSRGETKRCRSKEPKVSLKKVIFLRLSAVELPGDFQVCIFFAYSSDHSMPKNLDKEHSDGFSLLEMGGQNNPQNWRFHSQKNLRRGNRGFRRRLHFRFLRRLRNLS